MTIASEEYRLDWTVPAGDIDAPATSDEIRKALDELKRKAANVSSIGEVLQVITRTPVADVIRNKINDLGFGHATMDIMEDPRFVPEKGGYQSTLYVAQTAEIMNAYIDNI
jgi:hypothetical protein